MDQTEAPVAHETERCNGRKKGHDGPKMEPGEWAGEGYCRNEVGKGTEHLGVGRCKYHGGSNPVKHGRYSRYLETELGDEIERLQDDPDPLDLSEELAMSRALLKRASNNEELSEQDRMQLVSEVSKIVKRIEDIRSQDALSRPELARIYSEMYRAVQTHTDESTAQQIAEEWSRIRL